MVASTAATAKDDTREQEGPPASEQSVSELPGPVQSAESEVSSAAFVAFARSALADFEAGRNGKALALFERALEYPASRRDRATVQFNVGGCLMRLGRYDDAERAFLESAALDPVGAEAAWLLAGSAALQADRLQDAKLHLSRVQARDAAIVKRVQSLETAIRAAEDERAAEQRLQHYARLAEEGATAFSQRRYLQARMKLEQALRQADDIPDQDRANLHYGVAVAAYHLKDWSRAAQHIDAAVQATPEEAEFYLLKARVALRMEDLSAAKVAAKRAAELGQSGDSLRGVEAELDAMSPLPASGWSGHVATFGGWDSNPLHSGVGVDAGPSQGDGGAGSATLSGYGSLALTGKSDERTALGLYYSVDWLGLVAQPVREFSVQGHELGTRWYRQLGERWFLRLAGGGGIALVGAESPELMTYEAIGSARLSLDPLESATTRLDLRMAVVAGEGDYDYLGGVRGSVELAERWQWELVQLELAMGGKYVGIGRLDFAVTAEEFPACVSLGCVGRQYRVPLAYAAPRLRADLAFDITRAWRVGIELEGEYRRYLTQSMIAGQRDSRKLRVDWRWRAGTRTSLALDAERHWALVVEYGWLGSISNVAYEPDDSAHYLDYGDRNFGQHLVEVGVSARF